MGRGCSDKIRRIFAARQKGAFERRDRIRNRADRCDRNASRTPKKGQKFWYSGKKKRHTIKAQVTIDKKNRKIICTAFSNGKRHDFRLFKESKVRIKPETLHEVDTGFQGIQKLHATSLLPKKRSKKHPLSKEDKRRNRAISSSRVANEHVIGCVKRFRIVSEKYRNRRKRFGLRFNLVAAFYILNLGV